MAPHLTSRHLKKHQRYTDNKQPSIISTMTRQTAQNQNNSLEKHLIRWAVVDQMSFQTLESPRFLRIYADLGITLPFRSARTLQKRIKDEFAVHRQKLMEDLANPCSTISISLDAWTSKNGKATLGIIGYWITENFEYRERVLDFKEIKRIHTGQNMAEILGAVLEEFKLETKLLAITTDNASTNETMVNQLDQSLKEAFSPRELRFDGLNNYMRCTAHVLNLIVGDILKALRAGGRYDALRSCELLDLDILVKDQSPLSRLRTIAVWVQATPQRKEQWRLVCQSHRLPDKLIEYDVDTRWNSTYRMLRDGLQAKQQIKKWGEQHRLFACFDDDDWEYLQQIANLLAPFEEMTLEVSKKKPKISMAMPIYFSLHDVLYDAAEQVGDFTLLHDEIAAAVSPGIEKYKKYFGKMDGLDAFYIAVVLDPRFKGRLLEKNFGKEGGRGIINHIKKVLQKEYSWAMPPALKPTDNDGGREPERGLSLRARVLRQLQPERRYVSDIDRYFDDGLVFDDSDVDGDEWLLSWWRGHSSIYPCVAAAARDYLAIPASSVSVERLFSGGRDMISVRRDSLSAETMRILPFLRDAYLSEDACAEAEGAAGS